MNMHNTFTHGFTHFFSYTRSCVCFSHYLLLLIFYLQLLYEVLYVYEHWYVCAGHGKEVHDDDGNLDNSPYQ